MRVTNIEMTTARVAEALNFSLNPSDQGAKYQIRNIAGLDAPEITPKFYGKGDPTNAPDARFYDMGMKTREIVFEALLNPNWVNGESYSDLRDELYRAISATRTGGVSLTFYDGPKAVAGISGFITKFEVNHMVKRPFVTMTVSCDDPMMKAISPIQWLYGTTAHPGTSPIIIPDSISTAPHGFSFMLSCHTATPDFTIADQLFFPTWTFQVVPSGGFLVGDVLHFSSEVSDPELYITRAGNDIHLIDKIVPESVWPFIFPGNNVFFMDDLTKFDWTGYLEYYPTFWGV